MYIWSCHHVCQADHNIRLAITQISIQETRSEVLYQKGPEGTRTREPDPGGSRSRRQDRDPDKNRQNSKTREQPGPEKQRGRELGMTTDQKNGQRQVKGRKKLELLSEKINLLYMLQCTLCNAIL